MEVVPGKLVYLYSFLEVVPGKVSVSAQLSSVEVVPGKLVYLHSFLSGSGSW